MISINVFIIAYLCLFLITSAMDLIIDAVNATHLKRHGHEVPEGFEGYIDGDKLERIEGYSLEKTRLSLVESVLTKLIFLSVILSGVLPWLTELLAELPVVPAGLIFFALPGLAGAVAGLPFDYYRIFVIEERYGFNTRTLKIWVTDLLKALAVSLTLGAVLLSAVLLMVTQMGASWWFWAWLVFFGFQLLLTVLYPTVIAPIFNKFSPVDDAELVEKIGELAHSEGIRVKDIVQMDASRRSRHTNAYFTGLGKTKRIVLYDSLLASHDHDEILAILAHEIGHFKKKHIKKQLIFMAAASLILLYLASLMIDWSLMYESFGFSSRVVYAGLLLVAVLWEPAGFFLSPISMALSRHYEREADRHVWQALKDTSSLVTALKKMARDNLANLRPHPLFVWFNYSHPPMLERIKGLEEMS
jgi:STE24 endopeptidase